MAQDTVSIDIDGSLATLIDGKIQSLQRQRNEKRHFSLFRVPAHIRESNKNYYEPRMISIGPYHRGSNHLRAMEEHKWLYLQDFLRRDSTNSLQTYVDELKTLEPSARKFYFESFDLSSNEFTEMMLLDGCFILEYLFKMNLEEDDSVFDTSWSIYLISDDLLMLENQIPFFVLERLYHLLKGSNASPSLFDILVEYLMYGDTDTPNPKRTSEIHHLLHLYYQCFVPDPTPQSNSSKLCHYLLEILKKMTDRSPGSSKKRAPRMIPCATELHDAGVTFKKRKKTGTLVEITFDNGVLEIPYFSIQESTKCSFMNLLAFEQCLERKKRYLTSYAAFMDCILNTANDVTILQHSGIIENRLASEEEVAFFFNHLRDCSHINYDDHYHVQTFRAVQEYYESRWLPFRTFKARIRHEYFSNPWSMISLLAAVTLLLLTLAQTIFTILAYVCSKF